MVGRKLLPLLGVAVLLGVGAPAAQADEALRLVMVEHSPFMIEQLEKKGYDVGFVGEKYEAAVYLDNAGEAKLRAEGYKVIQTLEDANTWLARKTEIASTTQHEALASEFARKGIPATGVKRNGKTIVAVPGNLVIMRAYTFTNYAGRFLYVEAHNKLHSDAPGAPTPTNPPMSFAFSTDGGATYRPSFNMSNSTISPDGGDAGLGGNKVSDGDAASNRYMYHRGLIALRDADANLTASQITVRVADSVGNSDTSGATEWAGEGMPPRVAGFQKDFITKYMDPTETYARMDQLTAQFPDIVQAINLPNITDGYQRKGMAMMAGTTAANANPNGTNTPFAVQLFSKAQGHQGGNNITAEFTTLKDPQGVVVPNSPLSITVTDGTWRTHDPADTDASNGISEVTIPTKDIVVNLATSDTGALTSTAAQVIAAITADPAASALVEAFTYGGNAGAGIVPVTPSRTYTIPEGTTNAPAAQTFTSTKVKLSDYLRGGTVYWAGSFPTTANPAGTLVRTDSRHIQKGPFQQKVYRIGKDRSNNAVGVFFYCQQHAREWVTNITCLETAERLARNYATDPTTKEYVDRLNIFILPVANPDGGHYAFHDNSVQRKNMKSYCPVTATTGGIGNRQAWGVDLNRNNTVGTLFDGYAGASTSCTSETFTGIAEATEAEIKNEHWIGDTFQGIKFANNIHTHGGYFMWAPGAYISQGRVTLPAPNIGIEKYFFKVADTILSHIKSSRGTVILPQRTGPIADALYSAAGNSADENWYKRGIVAYSFEAGAQRITVNPTTGSISRQAVGFQPCFGGPGTNGGQGATCNPTGNPPVPSQIVNEGHDSTMEFAEGNFGQIQGALEYLNDVTPPATRIEFNSASGAATNQTSGEPILFKFNWVNEPSVIFYTIDGTAPTVISDNPATDGVEGCGDLPVGGSTRCYNSQGPRRPGEVLTLGDVPGALAGYGAHTIKWSSVDMKGNVEPVQTQRLLVAADDENGTVGGNVPATLSLTLGTPAAFGAFTPGVARDYTASTSANVISTAGNALLSVADPSASNPGHLMNGSFFLPQKLQVNGTSAGGTGSAFAPVGGSSSPTSILSYSGPISNDAVTIGFKQSIGANDALRTGAYSKTLTFTLSTTQP